MHAVVEREPAVVLEDAQRFAGPVGGGIDNAGCLHVVGRRLNRQRFVQRQCRRGPRGDPPFQACVVKPCGDQLLAQIRILTDQRQ